MPFLKHLYLFIKNNLLQLQRKWLSLPLLILFPVAILLLITTIAITVISPSDQEPVQIGFVDLDQSEETQLIMGMITESSDIESYIQIEELTESEAKQKMANDELAIYVAFPDQFTEDLYHGRPVNFSMVGNPNKITESYLIKEIIDSAARHIRVAQASILTIDYYVKQLPIDAETRDDLLFSEFTDFLIYTIGKNVIIDSQTITNQATETPAHYYGLACWFIVMLLWTLIFFHILYQDKSQRMKNRMRLYGVTQLQQLLAKSVVTLFITGILSVGSFMILQKILAFALIGEDYRRIFSVGVLLHIIFLECLAILEQIIRSSKVRLLGQSVFTLGIILLSGAIIPTLYFPMVIQKGLTYLFSYQAFYWFQEVLLQQRFYVDYIPLIGMSIVGLLVLIAISLWKERIH